MERDALRIQQRIGATTSPFRYGLAAAAIWIGVAYGLLTPQAPFHPSRLQVALATCAP